MVHCHREGRLWRLAVRRYGGIQDKFPVKELESFSLAVLVAQKYQQELK